ncbi:MAG TPA: IgGFc-binding protein, partial [Polyangiaceae bacterium]
PIGCYSFTNDASLLFPTTALTGNYRVTGHPGWSAANIGATLSITATQDATTVTVAVGSAGQVIAGTGIAATAANGTLTLTMNAGDVAELVGGATDTSDLSGSLVQATNPVQVITGVPCLDVPSTAAACDHVEESNFPAETLGKDYVVAQPTGPKGDAVGQLVTFYGNVDGTTLAYVPSTPAGCPATLNAGQVVTCGVVAADFEVTGSQPFAVSVHTQGASVVDPLDVAPDQQGDPDQSLPAPVEQYRSKYVFLAPTDYPNNDLVVVEPTGTTVTLDGVVATGTATPIGTSAWSVLRITLGTGTSGAHTLTASSPVGLQVMGYGSYTSYQYPGGLDLEHIAPPPSL